MKRLALFIVIVMVMMAAPSMAQQSGDTPGTRGIRVVGVKTRQGQQVELYKASHALLIGVSDYTAGWPDLESIPGEMDLLEKALLKQGFSVTRLRNPNSSQLKKGFEDFIEKYGYDEESRLLFFYSGHGYTREVRGRQKGYLVPTDAPNPNLDEKNFIRKALPMGQVQTWARQIEAKHALFLFDSCFSGTIFKTRALPVPRYITNKTIKPVRQFITAGSAGEEVPAVSVFLPTFIRAIEGEGDINSDGYVTGTELGQYLNQKVMGYDVGQTPQYGKIKDPALDEGDFVFPLPRALVAAMTQKPPSPKPAAAPVNINAEEDFWKSVRDSGDADLIQAYLAEYPKGRFVALARVKLIQAKKGNLQKQQQAQREKEDRFWNTVKDSNDSGQIQAYLEEYPKGRYAELARLGLQSLRNAPVQPRVQARRKKSFKISIFSPYYSGGKKNRYLRSQVFLFQNFGRYIESEKIYKAGFSFKDFQLPFVPVNSRRKKEQIAGKTWTGFFSKSPDSEFIYNMGADLKTDLVFTYYVSFGGRFTGSYKGYLFDIRNEKLYEDKGSFNSGFNVAVSDSFSRLLNRYKNKIR